MTAEEQSDKMVTDMEVCMKQMCVIEFLHVEKIAPKDIYQRLLNVYRDKTVSSEVVSGVFQQWRQRHERQATFRTAMHSCRTTK